MVVVPAPFQLPPTQRMSPASVCVPLSCPPLPNTRWAKVTAPCTCATPSVTSTVPGPEVWLPARKLTVLRMPSVAPSPMPMWLLPASVPPPCRASSPASIDTVPVLSNGRPMMRVVPAPVFR